MIGNLQSKVIRLQDVELEVKQLRDTLAEYNEEFRQVRNQGKEKILIGCFKQIVPPPFFLKSSPFRSAATERSFVFCLNSCCSPVQIQEPVSVDNASFHSHLQISSLFK